MARHLADERTLGVTLPVCMHPSVHASQPKQHMVHLATIRQEHPDARMGPSNADQAERLLALAPLLPTAASNC